LSDRSRKNDRSQRFRSSYHKPPDDGTNKTSHSAARTTTMKAVQEKKVSDVRRQIEKGSHQGARLPPTQAVPMPKENQVNPLHTDSDGRGPLSLLRRGSDGLAISVFLRKDIKKTTPIRGPLVQKERMILQQVDSESKK